MKIIHISDLHIRNFQYQDEYQKCFVNLYDRVKEIKNGNDNVVIILTGDIFHSKTNISPEAYKLASDLLKKLGNECDTYIIPGNHDGNIRSNRMDAIEPIVHTLKMSSIFYLKNSCLERIQGKLDKRFVLKVFSIYDEEGWNIKNDKSNDIVIGLYHGIVDGAKNDKEYELSGKVSIQDFKDCDYVLLGDVHKSNQIMDKQGKIRYAGSFIQQNFGEDEKKGFLVWDIKDKSDFSVEFVEIEREFPFITIEINDDISKIKKGSRIRLILKEKILKEELEEIKLNIKRTCFPILLTVEEKYEKTFMELSCNSSILDIRSEAVQRDLLREYSAPFKLPQIVLERLYSINGDTSGDILLQGDKRHNIKWSIERFNWDNLFNYGVGNTIDLGKKRGIIGIFGDNYTGKSSFIDSFIKTIFNNTSRGNLKNYDIINHNAKYGFGKVFLKSEDDEYSIDRKLVKGKGDNSSAVLDFMKNGTSLNGDTRVETDKNIMYEFGTMEDFLLTSLSSQLDALSFIREGSTKRKEILAKFLDLDIFNIKLKAAKPEYLKYKTLLKEFEENYDLLIEKEIEKKNGNTVDILQISEKKEIEKKLLNSKIELKSFEGLTIPSLDEIDEIKKNIKKKDEKIVIFNQEIETIQKNIANQEIFIKKFEKFVLLFEIDKFREKEKNYRGIIDEIEKIDSSISFKNKEMTILEHNISLLNEVPCGENYKHCKFIKNAFDSKDKMKVIDESLLEIKKQKQNLEKSIENIDYEDLVKKINVYEESKDKYNRYKLDNAISLSKIDEKNEKKKELNSEIADLYTKIDDYNLSIDSVRKKAEIEEQINKCETRLGYISILEKQQIEKEAIIDQRIKDLREKKKKYEETYYNFFAYETFINAVHPNGIPSMIIKKNIDIINNEINNFLSKIVDFEIFLDICDKDLNVYLKRDNKLCPIENCSGAEKTIAAMAIRLSFIEISSLPKSNIFILDEPAVFLDKKNLSSFVDVLEVMKEKFDIIFLISHLDELKDCADITINIENVGGNAFVNC
ncbi:metallophosphoesterase [Candidatus Pacearchaeota archaeon]|nr:metallophosphoesterase [Candidatus Pacearchaeota archaeon]